MLFAWDVTGNGGYEGGRLELGTGGWPPDLKFRSNAASSYRQLYVVRLGLASLGDTLASQLVDGREAYCPTGGDGRYPNL